jgi:hypothetical protein
VQRWLFAGCDRHRTNLRPTLESAFVLVRSAFACYV